MQKQKSNKAIQPSLLEKTVKIQINEGKMVLGLGVAGDICEVGELVAQNFVAQGLATILEKEN